jgi:hypothetical protein
MPLRKEFNQNFPQQRDCAFELVRRFQSSNPMLPSTRSAVCRVGKGGLDVPIDPRRRSAVPTSSAAVGTADHALCSSSRLGRLYPPYTLKAHQISVGPRLSPVKDNQTTRAVREID